MLETLDWLLATSLIRKLERSPDLELSDAIRELADAATEAGLPELGQQKVAQRLATLGTQFKRVGVLNPLFLNKLDLRPHFFLLNAEPGWLQYLIDQSEERRERLSQYIVYGDWDSLLILYGTDSEAEELRKSIEDTYGRVDQFTARSVPFLYRHRPEPLNDASKDVPPEEVNAIVANPEIVSDGASFETLVESRILLGATWLSTSGRPYGVVAFVGIKIKSRENIDSSTVLTALNSDKEINATLVHLFEIRTGLPYHYVAKLACASMQELDIATDAISSLRFGSVAFEGITLVVATGRDQIPVLPTRSSPEAGVHGEGETTRRVLREQHGEDAVRRFDSLDRSWRFLVHHTVNVLEDQLHRRTWDDDRNSRITAAVRGLEASALQAEGAEPSGAVLESVTTVEGYLKHALRRITEDGFDKDLGRAQTELKLPGKDYRKLSMGKTIHALRTAKTVGALERYHGVLTEEWLDRLDDFAEQRNRWAHDGLPRDWDAVRRIEEARIVIVESIEILRWLSTAVIPLGRNVASVGKIPAQKELVLKEAHGKGRSGVFISHSSLDKETAERIALALGAFGHSVWYDAWSIAPGDSIVTRISEGLTKNDVLVLLLSPNSVKSRWVERELNSALMAQLSGHRVAVVPIKMGDVELPPVLRDIRYIDIQKDFENGMMELLNFLRRRRAEPVEIERVDKGS